MLIKLMHQVSKLLKRFKKSVAYAVLVITLILAGHTVSAQITPQLNPLSQITVPKPANLGNYISDQKTAIALGKALFWDMQLGTDGVQSCASCHFHAGADNRSKNQINPGQKGGNNQFDIGGHPNYQLLAGNFPFQVNDVAGSQGVFRTKFVDIIPGSDKDNVTPLSDQVFKVQGVNVRQVTDRNSPSVINSVFNFRNFWDGRAQDIFNGVNGAGLRDKDAFVLKAERPWQLQDVKVELNNSSLASQAVGPPLSAFETASEDLPIAPSLIVASETNQTTRVLNVNTNQEVTLNGSGQVISGDANALNSATNNNAESGRRSNQESSTSAPFRRVGRKLGKKLLALTPLNKQQVARDDSVLGEFSRGNRPGLNVSYETLIKMSFKPEWWNSNLIVQIDPQKQERRFIRRPGRRPLTTNEYTLMEYNFGLFFGLAIQAYESTLVSDQTPFDQFLANKPNALTAEQKKGWEIFQTKGLCITCHAGSELTDASVRNVASQGRIRRLTPPAPTLPQDTGFNNVGLRTPQEDIGVGGPDNVGELERPADPTKNNSLSETRLAQQGKFQQIFGQAPPTLNPPLTPNEPVFVDGAFKTPGLRNIELTAPYFHNGGALTLEQVVEFYNRGGNLNILPPLSLSDDEKKALVAFMKGLTDERVRYQKAPFDHPQLFVPNGHPGNEVAVEVDTNVQTSDGVRQAKDALLEIPAVGRNGSGTPLRKFLGLM